MKIKISSEPQERELAERIVQAVQPLLPRYRKHETERDRRRLIYLTIPSEHRKKRGSRENRGHKKEVVYLKIGPGYDIINIK